LSTPRHLHVLLVEDHRESAACLATLLRHLGHAVTVAGSLSSARAAIRALRHDGRDLDLALVDLVLPDGDGCELMPELVAAGIRGVSMSAHGTEGSEARRSARVGFDAHLPKPFDADTLQRLLLRQANAA
jgi:CheY-like chemotaxis protein